VDAAIRFLETGTDTVDTAVEIVEAAGVESQIGAFSNWLTTRDFWC
jgi:hypothetical protein